MRIALFMVLIALFAMVAGSYAALPSDSIFYRAPATGPMQLSGVDPSVAKMFAKENTLGAYTGWMMPNYGHYYSGAFWVTQENVPTEKVLLDFINNSTPEAV